MAYTYSDWVTLTDASARYTRLCLFIQEIEDLETADIAADGKSRGSSPLSAKLERLYAEKARLEQALGLNLGEVPAQVLVGDLRGMRD